MPEKLTWNYTVQVSGGPTIAGSGTLLVDAYEKLNVVVPGKKKLQVAILPGSGAGLQVLIIRPTSPSADLTYKMGSETTAILDGPHVLIGAGAVSLLAKSIGSLDFDNKADADAEISILAGRAATSTS